MNDKPHDEAMIEMYRKDPEFARQVINSILEDENGDQGWVRNTDLEPAR